MVKSGIIVLSWFTLVKARKRKSIGNGNNAEYSLDLVSRSQLSFVNRFILPRSQKDSVSKFISSKMLKLKYIAY
uniref:Uncharacterized protein n=1 Tax=Cannabis sativa TaxID=3483 RepID=A0A803QRR7_CANSA